MLQAQDEQAIRMAADNRQRPATPVIGGSPVPGLQRLSDVYDERAGKETGFTSHADYLRQIIELAKESTLPESKTSGLEFLRKIEMLATAGQLNAAFADPETMEELSREFALQEDPEIRAIAASILLAALQRTQRRFLEKSTALELAASQRENAERIAERFEKLATIDSLTGIANRLKFITELDRTLARYREANYHNALARLNTAISRGYSAQRPDSANGSYEEIIKHEAPSFALAFIDAKKFKVINDTLGHEAGDEALKAIATRLRNNETVARLGGDEFVVLLVGKPDDPDFPNNAEERLSRDLENVPFMYKGYEYQVSCNVGVVEINDPHMSAERIMAAADRKMYEQKRGISGPDPRQMHLQFQ